MISGSSDARGQNVPAGVGYSLPVEQFYTALLVAVAVATAWFACYVVYRLYSDHR